MSVLRPAQPSDLNQLLSWFAEYHAFEGIKSDHAHCLRAISPLLNGSPHGDIHIITQHGVDVGYVIFCYGWSIEFGGTSDLGRTLPMSYDARSGIGNNRVTRKHRCAKSSRYHFNHLRSRSQQSGGVIALS